MMNEHIIGMFSIIVFILSFVLNKNKDIQKNVKILLYLTFGLSLLSFISEAFFYTIGCINVVISITMNVYLLMDTKLTFQN